MTTALTIFGTLIVAIICADYISDKVSGIRILVEICDELAGEYDE